MDPYLNSYTYQKVQEARLFIEDNVGPVSTVWIWTRCHGISAVVSATRTNLIYVTQFIWPTFLVDGAQYHYYIPTCDLHPGNSITCALDSCVVDRVMYS